MADVVNARGIAVCGKSFTRVTQKYEKDLDKKGGAETQVDLADDESGGGGSRRFMQPLRWYLGRLATQRSRRYTTVGWPFVEALVAAA